MGEEVDNNAEGGGGDTTQTDQGPAPEVVAKATEMGWSPKEKFRGNPENWVDADEFVRKGEEVLPLIRANNRRLNESLTSVQTENEGLKTQLSELQDSITVLQEVQQRESVGRIDRQIKALRRDIEDARTERDPDRVVELQGQLDAIEEQKEELKKEPVKKVAPVDQGGGPSPQVKQELQDWQSENEWFGTNKARTAIANSMATAVRNDPAFKGAVGRKFLDEVKRRTDEIYDSEFPGKGNGSSKTLNGDGTATGSGRGTRRVKGYADLPADARQACDADIDRLVGPNKVYKKKEDYHAFYAREYFGEEA